MTQQENLKEFIERKLGRTWKEAQKALSEEGVSWSVQKKIVDDSYSTLQMATREAIARVCNCCTGDINAIIARHKQLTPFGEVVEKKLSVMATVDKLEKMVAKDYPECPYDKAEPVKPEALAENKPKPGKVNADFEKAFDKPEPVEESGTVPEENATNPEETDNQNGNVFDWVQETPKRKKKKAAPANTEDPPKQVAAIKAAISDPKNSIEPMTVEEYRQQLKDMCLKNFAKFGSQGHMDTAYVSIAGDLLADLLGEE